MISFEKWFEEAFSDERTNSRDRRFARYGFQMGIADYGSLMGKYGAVSKQYGIAKARITSLEIEVKNLKAERNALIEAVEA